MKSNKIIKTILLSYLLANFQVGIGFAADKEEARDKTESPLHSKVVMANRRERGVGWKVLVAGGEQEF